MKTHYKTNLFVTAVLTLLTAVAAYAGTGGVWTFTGMMTTPRFDFTATLLQSGLVLAVGGEANNGTGFYLNSAELYNPATKTWTATASTKHERINHTATLLPAGQVLVAGGSYGYEGSVGTKFAELFNPQTGGWSETGDMKYPTLSAQAVLLADGQVLLAGGLPQCAMTDCVPFTAAELYNPTTGAWTATGNMNHPREGHALVALPDGRAIVIGGNTAEGTFWGAEVWNPSTGAWTETQPMNTNRTDLGAILLKTGGVLVMGGITGNVAGPASPTAEIFDPSSGTWTLTGTMNQARQGGFETLLPIELGGAVLIVGGNLGDKTAEVYDPVSRAWTEVAPALVRTGTPASSDGFVTKLLTGNVLASGLYPQIYSYAK